MIMTSSPLLHPLSGTSTPLGSPSLRPKQIPPPTTSSTSGTMTPISLASLAQATSTLSCSAPDPSTGASAVSIHNSTLPAGNTPTSSPAQRSYARAPQIRPYQSPRSAPMGPGIGSGGAGGISGQGGRVGKDVQGDTKKFGELVVRLIQERSRSMRKGKSGGAAGAEVIQIEDVAKRAPSVVSTPNRTPAGSWEKDRVELIVDVPVWTPGCFQDLSTLHALRDTTLSHTHSLLTFLQREHSLASSYRLLARSTTGKNAHVGWGCIRLTPSLHSPLEPKKELKPAVRRSSSVHETSPISAIRRRSSAAANGNTKSGLNSHGTSPTAKSGGTSGSALGMAMPIKIREAFESDSAILDDDDDEEDKPVKLLGGYNRSGTGSEEEDDEESADEIVAREVERRGAKEGEAFLMTLFGQPALILT